MGLELHRQRVPLCRLQLDLHPQRSRRGADGETLLQQPALAGVAQPALQQLAVERMGLDAEHLGQAGTGLEDAAAGRHQDQQIATEPQHLAQMGQSPHRLLQFMAQPLVLPLQALALRVRRRAHRQAGPGGGSCRPPSTNASTKNDSASRSVDFRPETAFMLHTL